MTHETEFMQGSDGNKLFTQWWRPNGDPAAVLVISHGYAEHSGRYAHVGEFFAGHGYLACALDHRSHGKSEGKDTCIDSFDQFLADLDLFIAASRKRAPGKPVFLLGHSMGGEIAIAYAIKYQPDLTGVLLSAPSIILGGDISPFMIKLAGFLGKVVPRLKTIKLDAASVSRDPEVIARYDSDPLNYRGGVPARTGAEMNRTIGFIGENLNRFALPCFLANGSADKLVSPEVSQLISERCSSTDKTVKIYDGLYHEILNEPEKEQVMADMLAWMNARV